MLRDPKEHINIAIVHFGSKAAAQEDSRIPHPSVSVAFWVPNVGGPGSMEGCSSPELHEGPVVLQIPGRSKSTLLAVRLI